jgi:hypothetical protein
LQAASLGERGDTVLNVQQEFSDRFSVGTAYVRRSDRDVENNAFGVHSNLSHPTRDGGYFGNASLYGTTTSGEGGEGTSMSLNLIRWVRPGKIGWRVRYEDVSEAFDAKDGFVPELDRKGFTGDLDYFLQPRTGWMEQLRTRVGVGMFDHHSGGRFHRDLNVDSSIDVRNSIGFDLGYTRSSRPPHKDQVFLFDLRWNRLSLYESGAIGVSFGRRASTQYRLFSLNKGIRLSKSIGILLTSQFGRIPDENFVSRSTQQHIVSLNYDFTSEKGIGGRLVKNTRGTNMYLSYRQAVRKGMDAFFIIGDPNADRFSPGIAFKTLVVLGR